MSCDDFLDTSPHGSVSINTLQTTSGAESLLIAAYSNLDGFSGVGDPWRSGASNWVYGSIAGGDAYKGSLDGDLSQITDIETLFSLTPNNEFLETKWITYYQGISRANDAIKAFQSLNNIDEKKRTVSIAEARFLRAFYHFDLRKMFGPVPYIDERTEDVRIGNNDDILIKIEEDFRYAAVYLPTTQQQPGRITKGAAQSYAGICKMWEGDFATAKVFFDSVITSGRYALNDQYHKNFNADFSNTNESILEVQQSVKDGGGGANANPGDFLNYSFGGPGGCCGFHQPSQNLVNAFKTDSNGLPLLADYNNMDVTNDEGLTSSDPFTPYGGTLDPRLDWTVGRRGIPYLDWGKNPGMDWIRNQSYGGPYLPIKTTLYQSQENLFSEFGGWSVFNANNLKLLRYADILLFAAEAEVELGNLSIALDYVNQVRNRAANPAGFVKDGASQAANYLIKPYPTFPNKDYARKAVRFERRIELGMEGHRFFDLVRWGVAAEEKNAYYTTEKKKRSYLSTASFVKGKHERYPIPQKAIDLSYKNGGPTLNQNLGY